MAPIVLNSGDTAWMLASTALVLLMTPGLAFFYGGMVRTKSVLNMMMMSMVTIELSVFSGDLWFPIGLWIFGQFSVVWINIILWFGRHG